MLRRTRQDDLERALETFPVVALVGSRQSGKTTLAKELVRSREGRSIYLDLELPSDRARLADPESYLEEHRKRLVVLDEIHRVPEIFPILRGLVDRDRRPGRYLVLGSASPDLLMQATESLAGRVAYVDLPPLLLAELPTKAAAQTSKWQQLWLRGGYPDSFLAKSDEASRAWREAFLRAFLERDVPSFGIRVAATRLRRFWEMLAHVHGQLWNASALAANFDVSAPTVKHYLDLLTDLFVVRQIQPLHRNLKKRLVKSPKIYLRDSGLLHALLRIPDLESLRGHPSIGASFEGFAVEQILSSVPSDVDAAFYRTHTGVELDLVLTRGRRRIGVEVKHTSAPRITDGLRVAIEDTRCDETFVVTAGGSGFPLGEGLRAVPLPEFLLEVLPSILR